MSPSDSDVEKDYEKEDVKGRPDGHVQEGARNGGGGGGTAVGPVSAWSAFS